MPSASFIVFGIFFIVVSLGILYYDYRFVYETAIDSLLKGEIPGIATNPMVPIIILIVGIGFFVLGMGLFLAGISRITRERYRKNQALQQNYRDSKTINKNDGSAGAARG